MEMPSLFSFGGVFSEMIRGSTVESQLGRNFLSQVERGRAHVPTDILFATLVRLEVPGDVAEHCWKEHKLSLERRFPLPKPVKSWLWSSRTVEEKKAGESPGDNGKKNIKNEKDIIAENGEEKREKKEARKEREKDFFDFLDNLRRETGKKGRDISWELNEASNFFTSFVRQRRIPSSRRGIEFFKQMATVFSLSPEKKENFLIMAQEEIEKEEKQEGEKN